MPTPEIVYEPCRRIVAPAPRELWQFETVQAIRVGAVLYVTATYGAHSRAHSIYTVAGIPLGFMEFPSRKKALEVAAALAPLAESVLSPSGEYEGATTDPAWKAFTNALIEYRPE